MLVNGTEQNPAKFEQFDWLVGCFLTCLTLTRKVILVNFSNCLYIFHAIQPELIDVLFVLGNILRSEIYAWKVIFPRKQNYGKVWLE